MPIPISAALSANDSAVAAKADEAMRRPVRYLLSALLAGAFVGVAVVLLLTVAGPLVSGSSASAKLVEGAVFGIALTLVVFAGAELFTGVVMVSIQGVLRRQINVGQMLALWVASLVGNFVGSVGFAALVNASGVLNAGTKGATPPAAALLGRITAGKMAATDGQLFWRAVLCNFLVCLAIWMAGRTKSDAAKLICLWWALLAFIASGFEHSVANMTVFSLAIFGHAGAGWGDLFHNLALTVPGNIVGGGVLVGAVYAYLGRDVTARSEPVAGAAVQIPEPELASAGAG